MPDSLWKFSLSVYRRKGVEAACLRLQDRLGADVNVLMFCCWCGRILQRPELDRILAEIGPWQEVVVRPLRAIRRDLKQRLGGVGPLAAEAGDLRKRIAATELDAEQIELRLLESAVEPTSPRSLRPAAHNVAAYVLGLVGRIEPIDDADLMGLLQAALPDQPADAVGAAFAAAMAELAEPVRDGG